MSCSSRRRDDPDVLMLNCGYSGSTTSRVTPSRLMSATASSVKGFQYRMATYTLASTPRRRKAPSRARACSSVILRRGEPPPMDR